jgi:ethanolamine ammonia-lyase large subunit
MTKEELKNNTWEDSFTKIIDDVSQSEWFDNATKETVGELKSFIQNLLSQQKQELLREIREKIGGIEKLENRKIRISGDWDLAIGYNTAIEDIFKILNQL